MKKVIFPAFLLFIFISPLCAQQYTEADIYLYIEKYKDLAIRKMYEYKIPASITLAQGVFESACGTSRLATYGNNHFGIKCHKEWEGDTLLVDDDALGECFRKYDRVEESYNDHSLFLISRPRYNNLFTLDIMDYKAWAKGLKSAGYATNPHYAERLISLIERFDIAKNDTLYLERLASDYFTENPDDKIVSVEKEEVVPLEEEKPQQKEVVAAPETTSRIYFKADPRKFKPVVYPFSERDVYENNQTHFVIAEEGETYSSIAQDVQRTEMELRSFNEAEPGSEPQPGEVIYVEKKAKQHTAGLHTVKPGETLRFISQQYGVRLNMILKYNKLNTASIIHPKDKIKLKK